MDEWLSRHKAELTICDQVVSGIHCSSFGGRRLSMILTMLLRRHIGLTSGFSRILGDKVDMELEPLQRQGSVRWEAIWDSSETLSWVNWFHMDLTNFVWNLVTWSTSRYSLGWNQYHRWRQLEWLGLTRRFFRRGPPSFLMISDKSVEFIFPFHPRSSMSLLLTCVMWWSFGIDRDQYASIVWGYFVSKEDLRRTFQILVQDQVQVPFWTLRRLW